MFISSITNFQKVKYFNLISGKYDKYPILQNDIINTNPMLIRSHLEKIEESSQLFTNSIKDKNYSNLLYALYSIFYYILDTSDSLNCNLDVKLNSQNIYNLIFKYNIDLLSYIDRHFTNTKTRIDIVFNLDIQLLYTIHLDYLTEIKNLRPLIQAHQYDTIIEKLILLHDYCYLISYLFGFNIDILFDLMYQSNISKLADTEDIALQSIIKYQNVKYRKINVNGIHYGKFIIYNNHTGDILESINYIPVDFNYIINNSRDILVEIVLDEKKITPLLSPSYLLLDESEKQFIYHLSNAFNFSYDLRIYQGSHVALMMKELLTHIFLSLRFNFEFIIEDLQSWDYFIIYFYTFIISYGFYNNSTHIKIKPKFTKTYWYKLVRHPLLNQLSLDNWILSIFDRYLFNDTYRINNTISNNLYLGISSHEAKQYYDNKDFLYENIKPELLIGINTRLIKNISHVIYEESYITYCYKSINKVVDSLIKIKTLDYCKNNSDDLETIDKLILYFTDKSLNVSLTNYNDYLIKYLSGKQNPKINWLLGVLDFTNDPNHRKGYLSGFIYLSHNNPELLYVIGNINNNTSITPPRAKYINQTYTNKILDITNTTKTFITESLIINPIFLTDSSNKTRKIIPTFNSYILHIIHNFYTINSLQSLNSHTFSHN